MSNEPKQTAVEWLRIQVAPIVHDIDHQELLDLCEKALEMEREQINEAKQQGFSIGFDEGFKQGKEN